MLTNSIYISIRKSFVPQQTSWLCNVYGRASSCHQTAGSHSAMMDSFHKFNTPVSITGSCNCNFIVSNQILPTL